MLIALNTPENIPVVNDQQNQPTYSYYTEGFPGHMIGSVDNKRHNEYVGPIARKMSEKGSYINTHCSTQFTYGLKDPPDLRGIKYPRSAE